MEVVTAKCAENKWSECRLQYLTRLSTFHQFVGYNAVETGSARDELTLQSSSSRLTDLIIWLSVCGLANQNRLREEFRSDSSLFK